MSSAAEPTKAIKVFFSYSHKDEKYKDDLLAHLSPLIRREFIDSWDDRKTSAGDEWETEVLHHIDEADIILCLLSANYIHSDYCFNVEVQRARKRREGEGVTVIPILLKAFNWQETEFHKLQIVPRNHKAILSQSNRSQAFADVAMEIGWVVNSLLSRDEK